MLETKYDAKYFNPSQKYDFCRLLFFLNYTHTNIQSISNSIIVCLTKRQCNSCFITSYCTAERWVDTLGHSVKIFAHHSVGISLRIKGSCRISPHSPPPSADNKHRLQHFVRQRQTAHHSPPPSADNKHRLQHFVRQRQIAHHSPPPSVDNKHRLQH